MINLQGRHTVTSRELTRVFLYEDESDVLLWPRLRQLETARDLQERLLPNRAPQAPSFEIAARSTPALEVGGDHFNFFHVNAGQTGVLIADVSGKGLPAALHAAMLRSTMRTQAWGNRDVRDVLTRANAFLSYVLPMGTFITALYGVLDPQSRTFTWARAGHEPLLLKRSNERAQILASDGFPLGVLPPGEFREGLDVQRVTLNVGDTLLLYTDGLTEAMNEDGDEFGMERISDALNRHGKASAEELLDVIEREAEVWRGHADPHDDLTMLCLAAR